LKSEQQTTHKYLINRSQDGDRQAQSELYQLYAGAMYNICRRMTGDEEEAKDVLQEAFITVFINIKKLKEEATFSAWVKRIVINQCINTLKKKQLLTSSLGEEHEGLVEDDGNESFSEYSIKEVMSTIDKISEGCRTVLNLYLFEGYDHKEIAHILSISESASKAQYCKAKSKIRKILTD
jgi:RNA polymerase sigma-70 factor (ECF subfamily)